jgi:hypothetical protein
MIVKRHAYGELRAALREHQAYTEEFVARMLKWVDLSESYLALDARVVAKEYAAMRARGTKHKVAVDSLALKHERTPKRIEQLIRAAGDLEKIDPAALRAGEEPPE